MKPALAVLLLLAACAAAWPRPPEPAGVDACLMLSTDRRTDSLRVLLYRGPCRPHPDTAMGWTVPSRHQTCDLQLMADGTQGRLLARWPVCDPPPVRSEP